MKLILTSAFVSNAGVKDGDAHAMKRTLNRLGFYTPPATAGLTNIPERSLFQALSAFQKQSGLKPTGTAKPDDATVQALNDAQDKAQQHSPSYIWRTVGDDRVRPAHAALEGRTFRWDTPPDGFNPAEDYNCRCWAEPAAPPHTPDPHASKHCFDQDPWEQAAKVNIQKHEGLIQFPYLDTKGKITIGYGSNVDESVVFAGLPWQIKNSKDGRSATAAEIAAAYQSLRTYDAKNIDDEGNMNVGPYQQENWTNLFLAEDDCNILFEKSFEIAISDSLDKFTGFSCFPPSAKIALTDMMYNIGTTKFNRKKWVTLFAAIDQRHWIDAAYACHRKDVKKERNQATMGQFIEAAIEEDSATLSQP